MRFTIGQRAALFGLRAAGQSLGTCAAILGTTSQRVMKELPEDWRKSVKKVLRAKVPEPRVPRTDCRQRDSLVIELHGGGKRTLQEVANDLGLTRERVRQILARNGVSARRGGELPREVQQDRFDRYVAALKPGVKSAEACEAAGLVYSEVYNASVALGVKLPKVVRKERLRARQIADWYLANPTATGADAAKRFNVCQQTVSRALVKMGVLSRQDGWKHKRPEYTDQGDTA